MSHVDLNVRMGLAETLQPFGSCDDGHEFDLLSAVFLDEIDGGHGRTAGGQHGIGDHDGSQFNGIRQLAVVLVGFVGDFVPVEADVTYLCGGNQGEDSVCLLYTS